MHATPRLIYKQEFHYCLNIYVSLPNLNTVRRPPVSLHIAFDLLGPRNPAGTREAVKCRSNIYVGLPKLSTVRKPRESVPIHLAFSLLGPVNPAGIREAVKCRYDSVPNAMYGQVSNSLHGGRPLDIFC
jgi:hypothetical protein